MAINILDELQKKAGITNLKKVDANTEEVIINNEPEQVLQQAIIPTAVAGMYDCARSEEGLSFLEGTAGSEDWITLFFGKNAEALKENLTSYTGQSKEAVQSHFNAAAAAAVDILRSAATNNDNRRASIRNIAGLQRDFFVSYLPPALNIGALIQDTTLDDRTNKMEGPVSTLMHKLETMLTGQESKEEATKKRDENM